MIALSRKLVPCYEEVRPAELRLYVICSFSRLTRVRESIIRATEQFDTKTREAISAPISTSLPWSHLLSSTHLIKYCPLLWSSPASSTNGLLESVVAESYRRLRILHGDRDRSICTVDMQSATGASVTVTEYNKCSGNKSRTIKSKMIPAAYVSHNQPLEINSGTAMRGSVPVIFKEQQEPTPIAKRDSHSSKCE